MTATVPRLVCAACGWTPGPPKVDPYPFRCPNAGTDDGDHVVSVIPETVVGRRFSAAVTRGFSPADAAHNPFLRYRRHLYSWHIATANGLTDDEYVAIVERVDASVARVAGHGFIMTPFARAGRLSDRLGFEPAGGVWLKDETGNVSGSHKARHLMGVALYLEVLRRLAIDREADRPLAVASCGNAALAAAVVARAIDRRLLVFVPDHAAATIVRRLEDLGAEVTRCSRDANVAGDPSYVAFRRAIANGALPFSCQGNENGLVIDGAKTIVYEMVDHLPATLKRRPTGAPSAPSEATAVGQGFNLPELDVPPVGQGFDLPELDVSPVGQGFSLAELDRIFIQVGGGALASACVQALADCVHSGRLAGMPKVHAVQTCGGYPLKRAYDRLIERSFRAPAAAPNKTPVGRGFSPAEVDEALACARHHRSQFMWPWESEPRSIAGGILDDETYDWAAVVEGMMRSGGSPIVVDDPTIARANDLAREATGIDVDHTGSSGLAGLLALMQSPDKPLPTERVVALFTGVRRGE